MKNDLLSIVGVGLTMITVLTTVYVNNNSGSQRELFKANVEALADEQVSSGKSACYMQYTESENSHCFICGKCEMVPGIGSQKGGYCKW